MTQKNDNRKAVKVVASNVHRAMMVAEELFPSWEAVSAEATREYRVVIKKRKKK